MKNIIAIIFFFIICNVTYGVDLVVNKISVNGLCRFSLDTILYKLPFKVGNVITSNHIADAIKILFSMGCFEKICISEDNNEIIIELKERPVINSVKFFGNKDIKNEILEQILYERNIKNGEFLNDYSIFEVTRKLKEMYHSFGKFDVTLKINTIVLPRNRVDIRLVFSEGKTAKIKKINIFGNCAFSQKELLNQCRLYKHMWWHNIILFNNNYKEKKVLSDLSALRMFYLNHGYAKFNINETRIDLTSDKSEVYLYIYINEGLQYFFKSLVIHGNVLHYIPNIKEYFKIYPGELYNDDKIKEIEHNIRYVLGKYGYISPVVSIEYGFNNQLKTVDIYIYIDVGNQFYVNEIRFEGNYITQDSVIRREIRQMEQSPLDYNCILKDQEKLQRCNYFDSVTAYIEKTSNILNQVNLIYSVRERYTGSLNFSIGVGTESGLNMQIGMNQENLLGTGNSISMTINKNHHQTCFDASVLKKFYGAKKHYVSSKIFYNNFFTDKINLSNYSMKNYGIDLNFLYPITRNNTYNIGLNCISNHLNKIAPQIAIWRYLNSIGINPISLINNKYLNNSIDFCSNDFLLILGWSFNNLNHTYFPEFGSCMNVESKFSIFSSNSEYYKITIDNCHYFPLNNSADFVLMSSMRVGYSGGLYSNKVEGPFYDNFYIGGIGSIRGFRFNSVGPKASYYCVHQMDNIDYSICKVENSQDTIGGNAVMCIRNELIVPLAYMRDIQNFNVVRISLFIDAGTVWDTHWKNTKATCAANILDYSVFGHIRISSGISMQWMSPVGPIIFSYSKLITKYPGDIEEPFQFTIGKTW